MQLIKVENTVTLLHEREQRVQKAVYIPHGSQTPSYKYTHTVCNRIHVCSPCSITGEMDIWPNFFVTSIPSPLKKKSPFTPLNPVKTTSVVH